MSSTASRRAVQTDAAPAAIGPYSQAIAAGNLLFCSGQIPLDPTTGAMVGEDAAAQAKQVMKNLAAVLEAAGSSFEQVVRTTIFLTDLEDFAAVNEVYGGFFGQAPPARATVEVSRLPKDARVEISAVAVLES